MDIRQKILVDVLSERERQNNLHPAKVHPSMRIVTIVEELGEVSKALQDGDMESVYRELIDTAACCVRMCEEILGGGVLMKKCKIINSKFAWILKVDGEEIPFQGGHHVAYFKKHYELLGYEVEISKE